MSKLNITLDDILRECPALLGTADAARSGDVYEMMSLSDDLFGMGYNALAGKWMDEALFSGELDDEEEEQALRKREDIAASEVC